MTKTHRVVDTSAWIEWLGNTELGQQLETEFPEPESCILPAVVLLELGLWSLRTQSNSDHEELLDLTEACQLAPMDRSTSLTALELPLERRLPFADRVIYATARQHGVDVLTCDAHFEGLPNVIYFRKKRSLAALDATHLGSDWTPAQSALDGPASRGSM